ncbi:MAG: hypothetical protein P8Y34_11610, partial [Anaerolineales bacterium]
MKLKYSRRWIWALLPLGILAAVLIYRIPAVNARLSWRIEGLRTRLVYKFNPPDKAVFVPGESTPLPTPAITTLPATPEPTTSEATEQPTEMAPGMTGTPLPDQVILDHVIYVDQHERWNYCGPANLAMALNYWGWPGDRDDIA